MMKRRVQWNMNQTMKGLSGFLPLTELLLESIIEQRLEDRDELHKRWNWEERFKLRV